jgi:hypothetical protein
MMNDLKQQATITLLEKKFPPSLFIIMTHLMVHLVVEVKLCGPIHTRWMYPMERYMKSLKTYVRNMVRPKDNMVEGYIMEEAIGFCKKYMQNFKTIKRQVWDDFENQKMYDEVPEGFGQMRTMIVEFRDWAHFFVIKNVVALEPWRT